MSLSASVSANWSCRSELLGALISQFGVYSRAIQEGAAIIYMWPRDDGISISVRASAGPINGILEFWVHNRPKRVDK
jgi:hypothetical protein